MLGGKRVSSGKHTGDQGADARPAGGGTAGNAEASAQSVGCGSMPATLAGIWPSNSEDARPQPTDAKCVEKPGASAGRRSSLPLKQLAPYAFTFVAMGFTCGFHTSVGRVLYIDYEHFNLVFLAMLAACTLCACLAKRPGFARRAIPAIALQIPLACACVAFAPLLFLSDRPDNVLWELIQNTLGFLSSWSLLVAITLLTCADATSSNKMAPCATPYCAVGVATFALGLFIGWLVGQYSFAEYGASGMAFRLGVTACIALLVSSLLAASTHMTQGATEPLATSSWDNRERADTTASPFAQASFSGTTDSTGQAGLSETAAWTGRADNKPQTTEGAGQAGIETALFRTNLAGNDKLPTSTGRVDTNESVASVCQTNADEPAVLTDLPGHSEPAVTATQAGHKRRNVSADQLGCEAGARMPMKPSAEVEGAVNTGVAAHARPLSHKTSVTPKAAVCPCHLRRLASRRHLALPRVQRLARTQSKPPWIPSRCTSGSPNVSIPCSCF